MTRRILNKLVIDDVSAVDRPANKFVRAVIMKRDDQGDDMSEKITKAQAEQEWTEARDAYLKRNNLSFAKGVAEFAVTEEARLLYSKLLRAQPGPPIAKQAQPLSKAQEVAAQMDVTCEVLAKQAFPDDKTPTAVAKFLETPDGAGFYEQYLTEKRDAGVI
jgi:hypothetical protein